MAQCLAEKFTAFHGIIGKIREQLHLYHHVADVSPLPTALISSEGYNVYTNLAYQHMLECSEGELLNHGWEQFTPTAFAAECVLSRKKANTRLTSAFQQPGFRVTVSSPSLFLATQNGHSHLDDG